MIQRLRDQHPVERIAVYAEQRTREISVSERDRKLGKLQPLNDRREIVCESGG